MQQQRDALKPPRNIRALSLTCAHRFESCRDVLETSGPLREAVEELYGQFSVWTAYVGAFAPPKASFDARLADFADIREMNLELLDIIRLNLQHNLLQVPTCSPTGAFMKTQIIRQLDQEDTSLLIGLDAVEIAIKKLHSLAVAIRRSSIKKTDKRNIIEDSHAIANEYWMKSLKRRFSRANSRLLEQIRMSIHVRGRSLLYQQRHNKKLAGWHTATANSRDHQKVSIPRSRLVNDESKTLLQLDASPIARSTLISETNFSAMDRPLLNRQMVQPSFTSSQTSSTSSSFKPNEDEQLNYPKKPSKTEDPSTGCCFLCSEFMNPAHLTDKKWRQHVNQDMELYICISEDCGKELHFFSNLREWKEHMQKIHTMEWPWKVHTTSWFCDLPHSSNLENDGKISFDRQGQLVEHLLQEHSDKLTRPQILIRARRSNVSLPRDPFTCPFCGGPPEGEALDIEEKPFDLLFNHIARHLRDVAFSSLSYVDGLEYDNKSLAMEDKDSYSPGVVSDDYLDDIPQTVLLEGKVMVGDESFSDLDELDSPILWSSAEYEKLQGSFDRSDKPIEEMMQASMKNIESLLQEAHSHEEQGIWNDAERAFSQVAEWRTQALGRNHPDTIDVLTRLASTINSQGRSAEVSALQMEIAELRKKLLAENSTSFLPDNSSPELKTQVGESGSEHSLLGSSSHQAHFPKQESPQEAFRLLFPKEKLVLDNPQKVTHIYDRGESFRLKSEQRNPASPRTIGTSSRPKDYHFEHDVIRIIAEELDEAAAMVPDLLEPDKDFIPRRTFEQIMTHSRVLSAVHVLKCFKDVQDKDQLAREIRYGSADGSKSPCVKLLAILIGIDRAEDMSIHMWTDELRDSCLPLRKVPNDRRRTLQCRKHKEHCRLNSYRRPEDRNRFSQWTYSMCSPFIKWERGKHQHYLLDTGDVFPMEVMAKVEQEERKSDSGGNSYGGFSEVYKVKIHEGHYDFGEHGIRHPQGYFALKKLTSHSRYSFNLELSSLVSTTQNYQKKHIIQLLATFEVKNPATRESTFYLLFDWADGTLNKFWQSNEALVRDRRHCKWMATQFYEVSEALRYVHNDREPTVRCLEDRDSNKQLFGRHGDIKPGNLLWFKSDSFPGLLALADFGLGRLHTQVSRSKQDPNSLERTATYRCPEFDLEFGLVSPRSDIFSLGCVFLEYVTWFLLGLEDVEKTFPDFRLEQDKHGFDSDVFFSIKDKKAYLKSSVTKWITKLKNHRDCSWYLSDLLDVIRDRMLDPESTTRIPSSLLSKKMKDLLKACTIDPDYYLKPKS